MTLTTRLLPFAEWGRLVGTELAHLATLPADIPGIGVVVVESTDDLGPPEIVGCWAAIRTLHVEGLWLTPDSPSTSVARRLFIAMMQLLRNQGVPEAVTNAADAHVEGMLEKIGGRPVPGRMWVFPVPPEKEVTEP